MDTFFARKTMQTVSNQDLIGKLKLDDLQSETEWSLLQSYGQAKLCMIMHGRDVAYRMEGSGVTVNSLNPGYIKTNLDRDAKGLTGLFTQVFWGLAAPPWVGGERIVAAALNREYQEVSGRFIYEDMLMEPNPQALDDAHVARLTEISRQMTGLGDRP